MPFDMSALNQNNKSLLRLATISEHVAADKRFGSVWVTFLAKENFHSPSQALFFFFFSFLVPVYSVWIQFCRLCVLSLQGCLLNWESTMSCWFRGVLMLMEDVQWEEPELDEIQMSKRLWKMLFAPEGVSIGWCCVMVEISPSVKEAVFLIKPLGASFFCQGFVHITSITTLPNVILIWNCQFPSVCH